MKSLILAHLLAIVIIAGCLWLSFGAFRRSWPRIAAGAGAIGAALMVGYWIF